MRSVRHAAASDSRPASLRQWPSWAVHWPHPLAFGPCIRRGGVWRAASTGPRPQVSGAIAGEASWRLTGHWHQSRQPSVPRAVLANGPLVAPLSRQYHNENPVFRLAPGQSRHLRSVSYCAEGIETPLAVTLLCQRRLQLPAAVRAATVQLPAALRAATY